MTQGLLLDPKIVSESTALAIYNKALQYLMDGKVYMSFGGEGDNVTTQFPIPVSQMLSEARYCLKQINPTKYGYLMTQVSPVFI